MSLRTLKGGRYPAQQHKFTTRIYFLSGMAVGMALAIAIYCLVMYAALNKVF